MLRVGLTGSIAVGKSHVCRVFESLGCHVLDADDVARKVVEPGTKGLADIVSHFGEGILNSDGTLDRKKLGSIVFADEAKRQLLNSITHPLVFEAQDKWLESVESRDANGIAIIDAALMIESGGFKRFDKLVVVWCEPGIQLKRLIMRDGLSEPEALKRIGSQMPQDQKKAFADFLIDTSGSYSETDEQVEEVFRALREHQRTAESG